MGGQEYSIWNTAGSLSDELLFAAEDGLITIRAGCGT